MTDPWDNLILWGESSPGTDLEEDDVYFLDPTNYTASGDLLPMMLEDPTMYSFNEGIIDRTQTYSNQEDFQELYDVYEDRIKKGDTDDYLQAVSSLQKQAGSTVNFFDMGGESDNNVLKAAKFLGSLGSAATADRMAGHGYRPVARQQSRSPVSGKPSTGPLGLDALELEALGGDKKNKFGVDLKNNSVYVRPGTNIPSPPKSRRQSIVSVPTKLALAGSSKKFQRYIRSVSAG